MSLIQAAVLGLVQGVTEFLPISSSAHLILASQLLGWRDQGLDFDLVVHTGSLVAVLLYFRRDLGGLTLGLGASLRGRSSPEGRLAWRILLATVPVAAAGLLAQGLVATIARNAVLIAATSALFGALLGWSDRVRPRRESLNDLSARSAAAIGLAQALALVPGTSRSGVTITAGRFLGMSRDQAARFSFLLAVPVGLLVAAKQTLDLLRVGAEETDWLALAVGFAVSAVSAYLAIDWLLGWVRRQSLMVFVAYRLVMALLIVAGAVF